MVLDEAKNNSNLELAATSLPPANMPQEYLPQLALMPIWDSNSPDLWSEDYIRQNEGLPSNSLSVLLFDDEDSEEEEDMDDDESFNDMDDDFDDDFDDDEDFDDEDEDYEEEDEDYDYEEDVDYDDFDE